MQCLELELNEILSALGALDERRKELVQKLSKVEDLIAQETKELEDLQDIQNLAWESTSISMDCVPRFLVVH